VFLAIDILNFCQEKFRVGLVEETLGFALAGGFAFQLEAFVLRWRVGASVGEQCLHSGCNLTVGIIVGERARIS
jgi:hypothetical protein